MIDPRLAWFAMGALCGAVLFGWPWHPRFSRYSRRGCNPTPPAPPYSSAAIAWQAEEAQRIYRGAMWREKGSDVWHPLGIPWEEGHTQRGNGSGGPTTPKPPIKPKFPPPRTIRGGLL